MVCYCGERHGLGRRHGNCLMSALVPKGGMINAGHGGHGGSSSQVKR